MSRHDNIERAFTAWFAFCAFVSLLWFGTIVWAVIELVRWVTSR